MKSEEEITSLAVKASIDFHEYENHYFVIAFERGYKAAQQDLRQDVLDEVEEALEFYATWKKNTDANNARLRKQGSLGSFGHVQYDVDFTLKQALEKLRSTTE